MSKWSHLRDVSSVSEERRRMFCLLGDVRRTIDSPSVRVDISSFHFSLIVSLETFPRKKFDFVMTLPTEELLFIEFDGGQHFSRNNFFHVDEEDFLTKQTVDIVNAKEVLRLGHRMIRIDYSWLNRTKDEIAEFILESVVQTDERFIVSNPEMYQWLFKNI
jgi:hypothetical protein